MKHLRRAALLGLLSLLGLAAGCAAPAGSVAAPARVEPPIDDPAALLRESLGRADTSQASRLREWRGTPPGTALAVVPRTAGALRAGQSAVYEASAARAGLYRVSLSYRALEDSLTGNLVALRVDGDEPCDEARAIPLPTIWRDASRDYGVDRYGTEAPPRPVPVRDWVRGNLYDNGGLTAMPLTLRLEAGRHEITIENLGNDLEPGELRLDPAADPPSYDDYRAGFSAAPAGATIEIEAIAYRDKNSTFINAAAVRNPDLSPYDAKTGRLNVIGGEGYSAPGQELTWEVTVPADARYELSFRYENFHDDFPVFRSLRVDGELPFDEARAIAFPPTGDRFGALTFADADGRPYEVFLSGGPHTLALRVDVEPMAAAIADLTLVLDHASWLANEIRRIAGRDVDLNRSWRLTSYLPKTADYLRAYRDIVRSSMDGLAVLAPNGERSSALSDLAQAARNVDRLLEDPDVLPARLALLHASPGSLVELLAVQLEELRFQGLALDGIALHGPDGRPAWRERRLARLGEEVRRFVETFGRRARARHRNTGSLSVWVNQPVQQVDLVQKIVDTSFTPATGIRADLSVMPDESKLVLAQAAGVAPDAAIGVSGWLPFELAVRGAARDLTGFEDFWSVASWFAPGCLVPLVVGEGVYALPERQDFLCLFYRTDIMESLRLPVPDTWDGVLEILPELERRGMGFYHQLAVDSAYKWFSVTYADIAQFGASLYGPDGDRLALDSPEGVAALDFQTRLFTTYALPQQVASFYNAFRYGTLPIGVGNLATYVALKAAAPEIAGRWRLAPLPGRLDAAGRLVRWAPGLSTTALMFRSTERPAEGWSFIRWWLSSDTQVDFASALQNTFGPEYLWVPANRQALARLPMDRADREVIRAQVDWDADPPKTPATYIVERGISDLWNAVVLSGVPLRVAVDRMKTTADREIRRKLEEFSYLRDGVLVKPFVVPTVAAIAARMERHAAP